MKETIKNFFKHNYKLIILYIILISLVVIKLDYQVYAPGGLLNLDSKIKIENSYKSKGSLNLTYVRGYKGNIIFVLMSYVMPSWDLIKNEDIRYENETEEDIVSRNKVYLSDVNKNAVYVSYKKLGYDASLSEKGVIVLSKTEYANTNLKTGDIIISVNNIKINNTDELINIISSLNDGQKISLNVLRDSKEEECYAVLKKVDNTVMIGIAIETETELVSDPDVTFKFKKNEMGPSGGLMTALKIYDMLTEEDITKGYKISGTGTISKEGMVGKIDGIKYKLAGAVKNKSQIFICPSENFEECKKEKENNKYEILLIEGDTFDNVLNKLNDLPYYDK